MTENKNIRIADESLDNAISVYKTTIKAVEQSKNFDYCPILDKVTVALLEELKQYRAIGTVEEIKEALSVADIQADKLNAYKQLGTLEKVREAVERKLTDDEIDCFNAYISYNDMPIAFGNTDWVHVYSKIVGDKISDYAKLNMDE